ncbi:agmatinase [Lujinxingia litoralis]|uniref:Agmatinase n=1 Tax=Lujinxingia litoralis TaxID=2211119 RepID=A0A328C5D3_9DELT|nr:agmatinase [Lujinxingia litoralis]RAL21206.1 agmatinase [Lujinxingia litoralis]
MSFAEKPYGQFLGSGESFEAARNILFGIPMDFTCCFRTGTRLGPREIRYFSDNLEDYSVEQRRGLEADTFYDAGDLELPFGNPAQCLDVIEAAVDQILQAGKRPVAMGGEHLVSAGIVRAIAKHFPDAVILHVDAHFDLRHTYAEQELSHATALRLCWNALEMSAEDQPPRLVQIGVRSGPAEEAEFAHRHIPQIHSESTAELLAELEKVRELWGDRPVYCTFDIDAVDPAYAPGTGTPEPGGLSSHQALAIARFLPSFKHLVGFDLVETSPPLDHAGITSALSAKMIREFMIATQA